MAKKVWGKTGKCVANKIPSIWYIKYNDEFIPKIAETTIQMN